MVRAKMRCVEKTSSVSCGGYGESRPVDTERVRFAAVSGDENAKWAKYTPSGALEMTINNPDAMAEFVVGKDYFIDISICDPRKE